MRNCPHVAHAALGRVAVPRGNGLCVLGRDGAVPGRRCRHSTEFGRDSAPPNRRQRRRRAERATRCVLRTAIRHDKQSRDRAAAGNGGRCKRLRICPETRTITCHLFPFPFPFCFSIPYILQGKSAHLSDLSDLSGNPRLMGGQIPSI